MSEPNEITESIEPEVTGLSSQILELKVDTEEDHGIAGEYLVAVKRTAKKVTGLFEDPITKAHQAHKAMVAARKAVMEPLDRCEQHLKGQMSTFQAKLRREREAEEARLQAEARKAAEDAALERAAKLEAQGRTAEAEAVVEAPPSVPAVSVSKKPAKVKGVSTRTVWEFEVEDEDQVPDEYWILDTKRIGGVVRALGKATNIPGVKVFPRDSISARV